VLGGTGGTTLSRSRMCGRFPDCSEERKRREIDPTLAGACGVCGGVKAGPQGDAYTRERLEEHAGNF